MSKRVMPDRVINPPADGEYQVTIAHSPFYDSDILRLVVFEGDDLAVVLALTIRACDDSITDKWLMLARGIETMGLLSNWEDCDMPSKALNKALKEFTGAACRLLLASEGYRVTRDREG